MAKRIMLLGDSWRFMYQDAVRDSLGENYTVWTPEAENCRFARYTLNSLRMYVTAFPDAEVMHFNCGMWDIGRINGEDTPFTPLDEYLRDLEKIVLFMQKRGTKVLFATTGTVKKACSLDRFPYASVFNEDIKRYNAAATELMNRLGVPVTDIEGAFDGREEEIICDDAIHPNAEGIAICADLVAGAIRKMCGDTETGKKTDVSDVKHVDVITA